MTDANELTNRRIGQTEPGSADEAAVDVAPAPEPFGLNAIPVGCKAFFLVHGELNATYARGYNQLAVGLKSWRPEYSVLPAFVQVERIWVALNDTEDNLSFVNSIAADKLIRKRCRISAEGVRRLTKEKMLWDSEHRYPTLSEGFRQSYDNEFEAIHHFQPLPTPSEIYKLRRLGRPKPKADTPTQVPPWLPPWGQW